MPTAITTQTIRCDLDTGKPMPELHLHQNDTDRYIQVKLYENDTAKSYSSSDYRATLSAVVPHKDGSYHVVADKAVDLDGNIASFYCDDLTGGSGIGFITIKIIERDDNENHARPVNIKLLLQKSADAGDVVSGASDFPSTMQAATEAWLQNNITGAISTIIDATLQNQGMAADAKATGDGLLNLSSTLQNYYDVMMSIYNGCLWRNLDLDTQLTASNKAAEAKATGDAINDLRDMVYDIAENVATVSETEAYLGIN